MGDVGCEADGTGSGPCYIASFGTETSGSAAR